MMSKIGKDIYVDVLILMIIGTYISAQPFFLISCAYLLYLILKNNLKLIIPKIPGFKLYIIVIIYSLFVGLYLYQMRFVIRDMYYVLPTVVWIFIGTSIAILDPSQRKDFYKTLFLYGGFVAIKVTVAFMLDFSINFDNLRNIFGQNVYDVGFIMPMALIQMTFFKRVYISKRVDRAILLLMSIQIVLSFGRIAILQPLLFILSTILVAIKYTGYRIKTLKRIFALLLSIVVVFTIASNVIPDSVSEIFTDKIMNTFSEVDAQQEITSVTSAMNNWRGYEIQAAQAQWTSSNIIVKIFGNGMGKGIEIHYVPYNWADMVQNNEIPLLHNGFYTMLIKGGIIGMIALIAIFVCPLLKGLKLPKSYEEDGVNYILVGASIAAIANTYVVRGPIQQGSFLIWALLIGWISSYLTSKSERHIHV